MVNVMKERKYINYVLLAAFIAYLIVIFIFPFFFRNSDITGSDFTKIEIDPFAVSNTYGSEFPDYQKEDIKKILQDSDLILKVKYKDYYQDYADYALVQCEVLKVIKGNYSEKEILIHDYVTLKEKYTTSELIIKNRRQYLPMIADDEYYVVLSENNPKFYEYTNIEFGRINVKKDKLFQFNGQVLEEFERESFNYDFIGKMTVIVGQESESDKKKNRKYKNYLNLREVFLDNLKEMEGNL